MSDTCNCGTVKEYIIWSSKDLLYLLIDLLPSYFSIIEPLFPHGKWSLFFFFNPDYEDQVRNVY